MTGALRRRLRRPFALTRFRAVPMVRRRFGGVVGEGDSQDPLKDLGRRLDAARRTGEGAARRGAKAGAASSANGLALAWRVALELVVAILVGTAIGWGIDRLIGDRVPWGMIIMFFLGTAAGMLNVWRAVTGAGMAVGYRQQQDAAAAPERWEDED